MNEIQKTIESEYNSHMTHMHNVISLMEKLPNHEKDCDCDHEHVMHIDLDIDWNDGSLLVGCMNCGGYVTI
jgi:hypothetical protein